MKTYKEMKEEDKAKFKGKFESVLRDWFLDNTTDKDLLDFVLNYGLNEDFKEIEKTIRNKFGEE